MSENDALSRRQRRFVAAVLSAPTIREAAKQAGVAEVTAWRYLAMPVVKAALSDRQDAVLGDASRRLVGTMREAMDVLREVMRNKGASEASRVSAARAVLDSGLRLAEMVALNERVADLERRLLSDAKRDTAGAQDGDDEDGEPCE